MIIEFLKEQVYHQSLELNALTPSRFAVEYLKEEFSKIYMSPKTVLDHSLMNLYKGVFYCSIHTIYLIF